METKLGIITKIVIPIIFVLTMWWAYGELKDDPDIAPLAHDIKQGWTLQEGETKDDVHLTRLSLIVLFGFLLMFIIPYQFIIILWVLAFVCAALFGWPFTFKEIGFVGTFIVVILILVASSGVRIISKIAGIKW